MVKIAVLVLFVLMFNMSLIGYLLHLTNQVEKDVLSCKTVSRDLNTNGD